MLKEKLDGRKDLQKHLYCKGFLITQKAIEGLNEYPFYGNWNHVPVMGYNIYYHKDTHFYSYEEDGVTYFVIGHAYNPFTMEAKEDEILKTLASKADKQDYIDELTGIFIIGSIKGKKIEFQLDCSAQQWGCYGVIDGSLYITSHMQLVGDICHLEQSDFVKRLVAYKWYHYMMGNYLPGDITSYDEMKRIVCNTVVSYDGNSGNPVVTRIYPMKAIDMCKNDEEYQTVIKEGAKIMKATMALIPEKWAKPAISLTGGIDSNTTFAAANGNYDKYSTFSYISMHRESVDAQKAKEISSRFNVPHAVYPIPETNEEVKDFELMKEIIEYNDGNIGTYHDNEFRKKITLTYNCNVDVEVKSWISETIRAYAYKYFGRTTMPKSLTPRNYTSLYKIFFMNRKLVWETDKYFAEYLKNTQLKEHLFNYDESDFFVWEMMHGGKCGLDIGVMRMCFDITIPYNNRKLLDLLLRVPLEKRLSDQHHLDLKKEMNKELFEMGIRVVNLNETSRRKKLANVYFTINSMLPF